MEEKYEEDGCWVDDPSLVEWFDSVNHANQAEIRFT